MDDTTGGTADNIVSSKRDGNRDVDCTVDDTTVDRVSVALTIT